MANMSYCRFQNTLADLRDCQEAMENESDKKLSAEEARARKRLIKRCVQIAEDFGHEVEGGK
jgi:hypothetical protein